MSVTPTSHEPVELVEPWRGANVSCQPEAAMGLCAEEGRGSGSGDPSSALASLHYASHTL